MRATYESIVSTLIKLITTMMGVKEIVMKRIDLQAFWNTIMFACNLDRDDASMQGHMLAEYKLDSRLKDLIPPRGVYISSDRLSSDLMEHDSIYDDNGEPLWKVLSPSEFMEVQAQLIGAMRKSVEFNSTLEEAIREVELASVSSRMVKRIGDDFLCHYSEVPFLPIPCTVSMYKNIWYNMPCSDMLKELSVAVLKQFR